MVKQKKIGPNAPPAEKGKSNGQSDADSDSSSSFMDLQSCCDVLGSLLKGGGSKLQSLDPAQLAALQSLRVSTASLASFSRTDSADKSEDDEDHSSHHKNRASLIQKLRDRRKRCHGKRSLKNFMRDSVREINEQGENNDDCARVCSFQVLDTFGFGAGSRGDSGSFGSIPPRRRNDRGGVVLKDGCLSNSGGAVDLIFATYKQRTNSGKRLTARNLFGGNLRLSDLSAKSDQSKELDEYCPPEWKALNPQAKLKLANLLSWENLSKWDFDIVEVAELTRDATKRQFCPLLLVGWALLCEPCAQKAMQHSVGIQGGVSVYLEGSMTSTGPDVFRYQFSDHVKIDPRKICNLLREIERRYRHENPYHNNIHAADVMQTTHALLQLIDEPYMCSLCDPVTLFSLLLAASFHDVGHPGTNNLFQQNAMTPLAIQYNDVSVLENMHSAVGHSLLLGEERKDEWDVFDGWSREDKIRARSVMMSAILHTDMSNHFANLQELESLVDQVQILSAETDEDGDEENEPEPVLSMLAKVLTKEVNGTGEGSESMADGECRKLREEFVQFLMHAADISNAAKKHPTCVYWADRALTEFFAQGDLEREMDLPISPLCDRTVVKRADSQIGFAKFVIQPTYELLGEIIPRVKDEILPLVEDNLAYWQREKARQQTFSKKRSSLGSIGEDEEASD